MAHRAIAALNLSKNVHDVIATAKTVVAGMTNNAELPAPPVSLATVIANITALEQAETVALTRAEGSVAARDAALRVVLSDLHLLKAYVQQVADAHLPDDAQKIIGSAHMSVKKSGARTKNDFEVKQGNLSGSAILLARAAGARASNEWEMSTDAGKSWTRLPSTLQAHTAVSGLAALQSYAFRHRAVTKTGESDWSQVATITVQ